MFETTHGGFDPETSEYVLSILARTDGGIDGPPRPWINVIANDRFGLLVSERGAISTWSGNSREHRLTPWSNDSVARSARRGLLRARRGDGRMLVASAPDPRAPAVSTRCGTDSAHVFPPRAGRPRSGAPCCSFPSTTRSASRGSASATDRSAAGVSRSSPTRNSSSADCRARAAGSSPRRSTRPPESSTRAIGRREISRTASSSRGPRPQHDSSRFCCDRATFIGRNRGLSNPAALEPDISLDGSSGAGLSPCFAQQVEVDDSSRWIGRGRVPPRAKVRTSRMLRR